MNLKSLLFLFLFIPCFALANEASVQGPDGHLRVTVTDAGGHAAYSVTYNEKTILEASPLGLVTNTGDFTQGMTLKQHTYNDVADDYTLDRCKQSRVSYRAKAMKVSFTNKEGEAIEVLFQVSNNDIAFKYLLPRNGEAACCVVKSEATGFDFPSGTTTFICPQSDPMIGWQRTKPSYEEEYTPDEPIGTPSKYHQGYTFPCLFHIGDCWALVSETGVSGKYCGSHLSDGTPDGLYTLAYPMEGENNGFGSTGAQIALPGETPWRTLTVGDNLRPIVETTIAFDVVKPLYDASTNYQYGRSTWHWMIWDDASCNVTDVKKFMDLAADMGYEYTLIDGLWDRQIGYSHMPDLIGYGKTKGVNSFLWYNSNGAWNDAPQGPHNRMDNPIERKKEMKWMKEQGVKGIKVDFWAGDKQETMKLYEQLLSDANDYGIMVIFHGCTLPRGWERMYPNYVGSEAVLASENLKFNQHFDDKEAFNACLHPFIRNSVGSMEFGGTILNKRLNRGNDGGTTRRTSDLFEIATAVLFQNPIQNFGLTPNNLTDAPAAAIDFMKHVPTTWDETRLIDGYPGKYIVLARRHGDKWYLAAVNATSQTLKIKITPTMFAGVPATHYSDSPTREMSSKPLKLDRKGSLLLTLPTNGANVIVTN